MCVCRFQDESKMLCYLTNTFVTQSRRCKKNHILYFLSARLAFLNSITNIIIYLGTVVCIL